MLTERSYFHGAAALINSLIRNGFTGDILVGYRGALPVWAADVARFEPAVRIRFVTIDGEWSLSNMKAHFMRRIATELIPDLTSLWYFDVDIVIKTGWQHFERWAEAGLVMVLDMAETYMPAHHVFRREWRAFAARAGYTCRDVAGYVNSGCVGIGSAQLAMVDIWCRLLEQLHAEGADMRQLVVRGGKPEFAKMDQDVLNAALMASDLPYSVLGTEAMDSFPSAEIMSHAMVFQKPWSRNYVLDAIKGFQPDPAHIAFWRYADGPIASFTPSEWRCKKAQLRIARLIGHARRRTVRDW